MTTDITIPPSAVEAAARALHREWKGDWGIRWDELMPSDQDQFRMEARAAILAALNAWPGMIEAHHQRDNQHAIILPTNTSTKETDNG